MAVNNLSNCICNVPTSILIQQHNNNRFTALFPGPPRWAGARRELLDFMVQGEINRGRHTDHPAGRHSIRTNQCPPPLSPPFFTGQMPFLPPNQQRQSPWLTWLASSSVVLFLFLFRKRTIGKRHRFCWQAWCPSCHPATSVWEHWRELKALTQPVTRPHPVFIHRWTPDGSSVAPFMPALRRQSLEYV